MKSEDCRSVKIGDVYLAELNGDDSEQKGIRPVIIFQNNVGNAHSPNVIVLPLTTALKKKNMPTHVVLPARETGLPRNSMVLCENPVSMSKAKLGDYITRIPDDYMSKIAVASLLSSAAISFIDPTFLQSVWERASRLNQAAYKAGVMYNNEIKEMFLNTNMSKVSKGRAEAAFNKAEPIEEERGIDLSEFSPEDVVNLIESMGFPDFSSNSNMLTVINSYRKWCVLNGYNSGGEIALERSSMGVKNGIKLCMVSSPAHLQKVLDSVFQDESLNTTDNLYRAAAWIAYSGMKLTDMLEVTKSEVDVDKMIIHHGEDDYKIYSEGAEALKKAVMLDEFCRIRGKNNITSWHKRVDSDKLMSGTVGDMSANTIMCRFKTVFKDSDVKLTYVNILKSGMFFHFMQVCAMGHDPDFMHLARLMEKESTDRDDNSTSLLSASRKLKRIYLEWKKAFYN